MNVLLKIMNLQDEQKHYEFKELFFKGVSEYKNIKTY